LASRIWTAAHSVPYDEEALLVAVNWVVQSARTLALPAKQP
jgi:hypothetical protein